MCGCNVQVRDDIAVDSYVLTDLESFRVGNFLSIEFPGDLRGRVASGDALDENWVVRVKDFFRESLSNNWWIDCTDEKELIKILKVNFKFKAYIVRPT